MSTDRDLFMIPVNLRSPFMLILLTVGQWCMGLIFPGQSSAWELEKDKEGIKVYTRVVKGSAFREYRAVMTISASLSSLVALVEDITECHSWIHTCKEGKLLKRVSPVESYTYTVNHAPWPVSDRDAVVHNTISQDPESRVVTIRIRGVPDHVPEKTGLVRVKKIKGCWRFAYTEKGLVEVLYQVHSEPGGNIPSWLVNSIVLSQPFYTLRNMRKMVRKPQYNKAKYDFISE